MCAKESEFLRAEFFANFCAEICAKESEFLRAEFFLLTFVQKYVLRRVSSLELIFFANFCAVICAKESEFLRAEFFANFCAEICAKESEFLRAEFLLTFVQKYVLRRVSSLEPSLSTVGHPEATSCVAPELRHRS